MDSKPGYDSKIVRLLRWLILGGWIAFSGLACLFLGRATPSAVSFTPTRLPATLPIPASATPAAFFTATVPLPSPSLTPAPTMPASPTAKPSATPTTPPVDLKPGTTQVAPADAMPQVFVPAGTFLMGATDADRYAEADEKPQHTVALDAFWIDRTEVTVAQYRICVQTGGCSAPKIDTSTSRGKYYTQTAFNDFPVINVNWEQAAAYCAWAGRRLPTEAEWEKAARGTDGRMYPWGEGIDCKKTNYLSCLGDTQKVGAYPGDKSPYGALDMAGNVAEWVADYYDAAYYKNSPEKNPQGPATAPYRVFRGGYYNGQGQQERSSERLSNGPSFYTNFVGFRCAQTP